MDGLGDAQRQKERQQLAAFPLLPAAGRAAERHPSRKSRRAAHRSSRRPNPDIHQKEWSLRFAAYVISARQKTLQFCAKGSATRPFADAKQKFDCICKYSDRPLRNLRQNKMVVLSCGSVIFHVMEHGFDARCAGQIRCGQAFARRANAPPLGGRWRRARRGGGSLRRQGCRERPSGELAAGGRPRAQSRRTPGSLLTAHGFWPLLRSWWIRSLAATPSGPLRWTCSSAVRLAQELGAAGHRFSERTVSRMLHDAGYSLQANRKTPPKSTGMRNSSISTDV